MTNTAKPYLNIIGALTAGLILVVGIYVLIIAAGKALDDSTDNQNTMFCKSAKVSGDIKYLNKCQLYYKTGSIEYMRGLK